MADSTRQQILDYITGTVLNDLGIFEKIFQNESVPVDIETQPLPIAFVFSGPEEKLMSGPNAVIGYENWNWRIAIEIWVNESDAEATLKTVHDAMWTSRSLNSLAVSSDRVGADIQPVEIENKIVCLLLDYDVLFRHTKGQM